MMYEFLPDHFPGLDSQEMHDLRQENHRLKAAWRDTKIDVIVATVTVSVMTGALSVLGTAPAPLRVVAGLAAVIWIVAAAVNYRSLRRGPK